MDINSINMAVQTVLKKIKDPASDIGGALKNLYVRPDVVAPFPTGVIATDTANLLAAIAATPENGKLYIPSHPDGTTVYQINAPLVVAKSMSIEGATLTETWKARTLGGALNHPIAPGVKGSVFMQNTAGADVLQLTGSGKSVNLSNLGLTWAAAILNSNTGHGILARPTLTSVNGGHDSGLLGFKWDNLTVYGGDGNHYAFNLLNTMYCTLSHLHSYGGGGMLFEVDSYEGNYGNAVVIEPYMEVLNAGTADGYRLSARTQHANSGVLNLLTFMRPQCNLTAAAATQGTQKAWNSRGGAAPATYVEVIAPDMEMDSGTASDIDFGGVNGGTLVSRGGLITKQPVGGMPTQSGYQAITTTSTFVVPDNVWSFRYRLTGAGGGGAGGGTTTTATAQSGGGGGGAGMVIEGIYTTTPRSSIVMTVGAAGTGGAGGASGGNPGILGGNGTITKIGEDVFAQAGGGGAPGLATSNATNAGGWYARTGSTAMPNVPGFGGNGMSVNGLGGAQLPPGVVGGGGGGGATTTNGGGGGTAAVSTTVPAYAHTGGGASGAAPTVSGANGTTAITLGCGGGGGGGGAIGGSGGNGGNGAPGKIEIWW